MNWEEDKMIVGIIVTFLIIFIATLCCSYKIESERNDIMRKPLKKE